MNKEFTSSKSQTDWQRLDTMTDEDIDLSDCPEITPEMFAKAVVRRGLPNTQTKAQVTLRIDSDILDCGAYRIWSPYDYGDAAQKLMSLLEQEETKVK
ncbi:hypothetical protein PN499_13330 [Kamptonema animale CS-326]|jgi:uncharacterized protein (DUF4415 family)|uniref:hypothetical protein n=1 Tax=Kamptonema animale TaxID=92934 RepID=UPI00232CFD8E|nr:hypothetical protein [Kamptonema animale]MDB9512169.1 hypothetical protein [Kamptonema animale CS-326]